LLAARPSTTFAASAAANSLDFDFRENILLHPRSMSTHTVHPPRQHRGLWVGSRYIHSDCDTIPNRWDGSKSSRGDLRV
jgi:hypothetical protein